MAKLISTSLFFILFNSFELLGQVENEWIFTSLENKNYVSCIEHNNSLVFISTLSKALTISILSEDGHLVQKYNYLIDSFNVEAHKIVWIESESHYLVLGTGTFVNTDGDIQRHFIAFGINEDFSLKFVKPYKIDATRHLYFLSFYLTEEEDVLVSLNVFSDGSEDEEFYIKLDGNGNLKSLQKDLGINCFSIVKNEKGYKCIGIVSRNFDLEFNLISKDSKTYSFLPPYNQSKALALSNERILIGTSPAIQNLPDSIRNGGAVLNITDANLNILKTHWMKTNKSNVLPENVFDISIDSNIFIANNIPFTSGFTSFSVGKFDLDLKKLWQLKFETLNEYRYSLWGLKATSDNGVLLYGSRFSWVAGGVSEGFIIKFNSSGNISWTNNINADFLTIKSYPNPSSGPLNLDILDLIGKAEIRVFDALGRNVYVQDGITDGNNAMDLSALQSGTYVYKIYQGGKEVSSGQWVKI